MRGIIVATGNALKMRIAQNALNDFGILATQHVLDIPEIQHEDNETIARDKAQKAYDIVKKPVAITDDSWSIPGLNGWPGPYMKSMNNWFTPQDFLRLTLPLTDRRVVLHQYIVFQDGAQQKLFKVDLEGVLTKEIRGQNSTSPCLTVISMAEDGRTVAEIENAGELGTGNRHTAWHDLGAWLTQP